MSKHGTCSCGCENESNSAIATKPAPADVRKATLHWDVNDQGGNQNMKLLNSATD
ncbi:MAG: hypothetical protein ACLSE6_02630 [Alphaproteobacteria bacterium]